MTELPEPNLNPTPSAATEADWVETHGDYLYHYALGQVRDPDVAAELIQETFLGALRARNRFAGQSSERTWLVGILRHKLLDHLRRACRERAHRAQPPSTRRDREAEDDALRCLHEMADECLSPSRPIELAEFRAQLEVALGKLPARLAQVFQLYTIEERPNREVCESLHISESNLWVMLHRARKHLRELLADWWPTAPKPAAPTPANL